MREDEKICLAALASIPDIGPLTIKRLIAVFGGARAVFRSGAAELAAAVGPKRANAIVRFSDWRGVRRMLEGVEAAGMKVVTLGSDAYPRMLALIPDPPPVFYMKGEIGKDDVYALGIVGTRTPTPYGIAQAEYLAAGLAAKGFTIVSGLARGIDTAAHRGALKAGGRSIAVMGSGLDVPYPRENALLMGRLAASGAVITEYPPGTAPNKENFPRRNRIISALSLGVLVVEAGKGSGSLITAGCALEQGKEVFSIPGNISSAVSLGTNELIKRGARVVTGVDDIIEELAPVLKGFIAEGKAASPPQAGSYPEKSYQAELTLPVSTDEKFPADEKLSPVDEKFSTDERLVIGALGPGGRHIDEIAREVGFDAPRIMGVLLSLELKGVIRQGAGKKFFIC
ncbi:MAG: DNA-processing protein DprA [Nitrospiraceae bacterium]|nr:DNA-processing protein DprA [Nitrospiraceae bacterium]